MLPVHVWTEVLPVHVWTEVRTTCTCVDGGTTCTCVDGGTTCTCVDGGTTCTCVDGGTTCTCVDRDTTCTCVDGGIYYLYILRISLMDGMTKVAVSCRNVWCNKFLWLENSIELICKMSPSQTTSFSTST